MMGVRELAVVQLDKPRGVFGRNRGKNQGRGAHFKHRARTAINSATASGLG
jgi:hypothetical protein